jgi:hypothetical protein
MYITNVYAKSPDTLGEKQEKTTTYNVVIIFIKNSCGIFLKKTYIILH